MFLLLVRQHPTDSFPLQLGEILQLSIPCTLCRAHAGQNFLHPVKLGSVASLNSGHEHVLGPVITPLYCRAWNVFMAWLKRVVARARLALKYQQTYNLVSYSTALLASCAEHLAV